jgi:hypothetical protein
VTGGGSRSTTPVDRRGATQVGGFPGAQHAVDGLTPSPQSYIVAAKNDTMAVQAVTVYPPQLMTRTRVLRRPIPDRDELCSRLTVFCTRCGSQLPMSAACTISTVEPGSVRATTDYYHPLCL